MERVSLTEVVWPAPSEATEDMRGIGHGETFYGCWFV